MAAGGEKQREIVRSVIIPCLRQEGHEELQVCRSSEVGRQPPSGILIRIGEVNRWPPP